MNQIGLAIFVLRHWLKPTAGEFHRCLREPKKTQLSLQQQFFSAFQQSYYSQALASITLLKSVEDRPNHLFPKREGKPLSLQERGWGRGQNVSHKSIYNWSQIPIIEYTDIQDLINRQLTENTNFFKPEKVLFYEKTSGSRSAAKLIPYTKSLLNSFNNMFCVWAYDIISNVPKLCKGKIYFCVSPQLGEGNSNKFGLANDTEYLNPWLRWFLNPFLVSSVGLNRISDPEVFKYELAKRLLVAEDLEIISIWNPTFLKVILDYIQSNQDRLDRELKNRLSQERSQLLLSSQIEWTKIWPHLKIISCWDSAHATSQANYLRSLFPDVMVQGKGLLATEAPMTIPLTKAGGCVPMLTEVFFEFLDGLGEIHLLHELKVGATYEIVISQKGGLYRYKIGDRVRVTHYYLNTPCLEFIGRNAEISDLVGEKLNEDFVKDCLINLKLKDTFFQSLLPVLEPNPHYVLLLDKAEENAEAIATKLDALLQKTYHYRQARLLGQLAPVRVFISSDIADLIVKCQIESGKKWGDIKHQIILNPVSEFEVWSNFLN
jgi:hypothetical protein